MVLLVSGVRFGSSPTVVVWLDLGTVKRLSRGLVDWGQSKRDDTLAVLHFRVVVLDAGGTKDLFGSLISAGDTNNMDGVVGK